MIFTLGVTTAVHICANAGTSLIIPALQHWASPKYVGLSLPKAHERSRPLTRVGDLGPGRWDGGLLVPKRKKEFSRVKVISHGSGRVGSGRVGSGRVGSGRVGSGRVRSGRVELR